MLDLVRQAGLVIAFPEEWPPHGIERVLHVAVQLMHLFSLGFGALPDFRQFGIQRSGFPVHGVEGFRRDAGCQDPAVFVVAGDLITENVHPPLAAPPLGFHLQQFTDVIGVKLQLFQLRFQFWDEHEGVPGEAFLGLQDVAINVIAHVKHLITIGLKPCLQPVRVATGEYVCIIMHGNRIVAFGKKGGFLRAHHHRMKVVGPMGPRRIRVIEQVAQHAVRERPLTVGEQEELFATADPAIKGRGQSRVFGDEEITVGKDLGFHVAMPVNGVNAPSHVIE